MSGKKQMKGAVNIVYQFCSDPDKDGNAVRLLSFTFRNDFIVFEDNEHGHDKHLSYDQFREMIEAYNLALKIEAGGI